MAKKRNQIAMSDEEIRQFLTDERTITVATINADGTPHLSAMWFGFDREPRDGVPHVAFWTYGKSQKVVNLRRDPRCTIMCEAGEAYDQLRGVSITGHAAIVDDVARVTEFGMSVNERYWGPAPDPEAARRTVEAMGAKRVLVIVRPDKVASWDHRKLGGGY